MNEIVAQVMTILRGVWQHRWHALLLAWAFAIVGWAYVLAMPDRYEAKTRVWIDTESTLRPLLRGIAPVPNDATNRIRMMSEVLKSRPHLERVARDTDLDLQAETPREMEKLVTKLKDRILIGEGRGSNLYQISYWNTDRVMAQDVVRTLLDTLMEDTLSDSIRERDEAGEFLEAQIRELEIRLEEAEERRAEFKKANVGFMPDDRGNYYARLQAAEAGLRETQALMNKLSTQRAELQRQLAGEEPAFTGLGMGTPTGGSSFDARIQQLEAQRDNMLTRFTEKHPDIVALDEQIAVLHQKRMEELQRMPSGGGGFQMQENPVYQNMKTALSVVEVELVGVRAELAQQQSAVRTLREQVDTVPEVEAQLSRLDRDYAAVRKQYDALVAKREEAELSKRVEANTESIRFRIVEHPVAPLRPVGPNRPLFLSMVLFVALAAGVALAVFLSLTRPVFFDKMKLRSVTGFPVLGSVSLIESARDRARRRFYTLSYAGSAVGLVVCFGALVFFSTTGARILQGVIGL